MPWDIMRTESIVSAVFALGTAASAWFGWPFALTAGCAVVSAVFALIAEEATDMTIKYLSVTDVSKRLGISTAAVSAYKLPQPDATIGRTRGWLPETHRPVEHSASRT